MKWIDKNVGGTLIVLNQGESICFEVENGLYYDSSTEEQTEFIKDLLNGLIKNKFVKEEDVINTVENQEIWLSFRKQYWWSFDI